MFSMKYGPLVFFNQYYLQLGKSKAKKLKTKGKIYHLSHTGKHDLRLLANHRLISPLVYSLTFAAWKTLFLQVPESRKLRSIQTT